MSDVYYIQQKVRYDYSRRSPELLAHDVTVAHDFIRKLVREKDAMQRTIGNQVLWIRILGAATAGVWALTVALIVMELGRH